MCTMGQVEAAGKSWFHTAAAGPSAVGPRTWLNHLRLSRMSSRLLWRGLTAMRRASRHVAADLAAGQELGKKDCMGHT